VVSDAVLVYAHKPNRNSSANGLQASAAAACDVCNVVIRTILDHRHAPLHTAAETSRCAAAVFNQDAFNGHKEPYTISSGQDC
jgi:hypothetical protein